MGMSPTIEKIYYGSLIKWLPEVSLPVELHVNEYPSNMPTAGKEQWDVIVNPEPVTAYIQKHKLEVEWFRIEPKCQYGVYYSMIAKFKTGEFLTKDQAGTTFLRIPKENQDGK